MAAAERGGPWIGLEWICSRCRSGKIEPVIERWGLEAGAAPVEGDHRVWLVRVRHPASIAATARLSSERLSHKARKLFGHRDPEVGDERFDDQIWVEADDGALALLKQGGVRATVVALLQVPAATLVELAGNEVRVRLEASTNFADRLVDDMLATPLVQVRHLAVILAAQLERVARSAP
jgi:hypothetical protein